MRWIGVVGLVLVVGCGFWMGAARGQAVDLGGAATVPSVMTGTVAERNAVIERVLAGGNPRVEGRVSQLSFNGMDVATALHFFSMQQKIDIEVPVEELQKQGVELGTVTLNLYNATVPTALEAVRWQVWAKTGVAWKVEGGVLKLVAVEKVLRATETEAEKKADAELLALLKKPVPILKGNGEGVPVAELIQWLSMAQRVNVVVDWKELEKAGVNKEGKIPAPLNEPTGEDVLKAAVGAMKVKGDGVVAGYEIWGGLVRVSTRARLEREVPKAEEAGLP